MLDIILLILLGIITYTYFGVPLEPFSNSREQSYGWPYYWKINNCCEKHYDNYNKMTNCVHRNVIYLY